MLCVALCMGTLSPVRGESRLSSGADQPPFVEPSASPDGAAIARQLNQEWLASTDPSRRASRDLRETQGRERESFNQRLDALRAQLNETPDPDQRSQLAAQIDQVVADLNRTRDAQAEQVSSHDQLLRQDREMETERLRDRLKERIAALDVQIEDHRREAGDARDRITRTQESIRSLARRIEQSRQDMASLLADYTGAVAQRRADLTRGFADDRERITDLARRAKATTYFEEQQSLQITIDQKQRELNEAEASARAEIEEMGARYQSQVAGTLREVARLSGELAASQAEEAQLERQARQAEEAARASEQLLTALNSLELHAAKR